MVIRKDDRVSAVLRKDESLVEVFASLSPAFERLRDPRLRKVMARLVTVEQAARMTGVDVRELVRRLNEHAQKRKKSGESAPEGPADASALDQDTVLQDAAAQDAARPSSAETEGSAAASSAAMPEALRKVAADRIVDLDVRDDLRQGREPFSRIMAARRTVPVAGVLRLRAIFEPIPLYAVMAKQGFAHYTEQLGPDDWQVWFYRASVEAAAATAPPTETAEAAASSDGNVVVLDVRNLEPPEPMVRTLAALETLPPGATLVQINVRVPQFLLPQLEERGFTYEVREQESGLVRVFIRRRADGPVDQPSTATR